MQCTTCFAALNTTSPVTRIGLSNALLKVVHKQRQLLRLHVRHSPHNQNTHYVNGVGRGHENEHSAPIAPGGKRRAGSEGFRRVQVERRAEPHGRRPGFAGLIPRLRL